MDKIESLLALFATLPKEWKIVYRILIGDESRVLRYDSEQKNQFVEYCHTISLRIKKVKMQSLAYKMYVDCFLRL